MTEEKVIKIMRRHLEGLFPRSCHNCHRTFATLRDFLLNTTHQGSAMPYDADAGDWTPLNPVGTMTYANCPCGSTLVLSSEGMPLLRLWPLLAWAKVETARRGMTPRELLNYLRDKICEQVLQTPD